MFVNSVVARFSDEIRLLEFGLNQSLIKLLMSGASSVLKFSLLNFEGKLVSDIRHYKVIQNITK